MKNRSGSQAQRLPPSPAKHRSHRLRLLVAALALLCAAAAVFLPPAWQDACLREAYLSDLESTVRNGSHDARLLSLVGARQAEAGDYKAAAQSYLHAIGDGDNDPLVWLAWSEAEAAFGDNKRARAVLNSAAEQKVAGLSEAMSRSRDWEATSGGASDNLKANSLLVHNRTSGSFLNKLVEWWGHLHPLQSGYATREQWASEEPQNAQVQRLWGEALTRNRDYPRAEKVLRQALALAPRSPEAHLAMAALLSQLGQSDAARMEYASAAALGARVPAASTPSLEASGNAHFVDVAQAAGLHYHWTIPGKGPYTILQTIGNGCAFLDYNRDGNLDILLVGPHLALYRGDGHGHFTDVTHETGLDQCSGSFLGCAVGDYDNDGWDDLYISAYRGGLLLHNENGKRFRDVTHEAGIASQPWGTSCAFADVDNDGKLDLYIANYLKFSPDAEPQLCRYGGVEGACSPASYAAERGVLYHNEGNGKFRDVTAAWGAGSVSGKALGVAFADYDGSGRQSLAIGNDEMPGDLLRNIGGKFRNEGTASGVAFDSVGDRHAGMGLDWGDYDNDGRLDLALTTFQHQAKCVYHNEDGSNFADRSATLGTNSSSNLYLNFGVKWLDYDNDGWLDLAMANGHVVDSIAKIDPGAAFRQRSQLFHNIHGQALQEVTDGAGDGFQQKILGRGLAVGDFDNDGRLDLLIVDSEGAPLLLHNETTATGHWLSFHLVGTRCNRDAVGAVVTLKAGGLEQVRRCGTDGSYLSASDARVHFGLGDNSSAFRVSVRWPDGSQSLFHNVAADRFYEIREDSAALKSS